MGVNFDDGKKVGKQSMLHLANVDFHFGVLGSSQDDVPDRGHKHTHRCRTLFVHNAEERV